MSLLFTGCTSSDNADQVNDKQGKIASALKVEDKNKDDKKDTNSEKKDKGKKRENLNHQIVRLKMEIQLMKQRFKKQSQNQIILYQQKKKNKLS